MTKILVDVFSFLVIWRISFTTGISNKTITNNINK